jgi:hypothetical protein
MVITPLLGRPQLLRRGLTSYLLGSDQALLQHRCMIGAVAGLKALTAAYLYSSSSSSSQKTGCAPMAVQH